MNGMEYNGWRSRSEVYGDACPAQNQSMLGIQRSQMPYLTHPLAVPQYPQYNFPLQPQAQYPIDYYIPQANQYNASNQHPTMTLEPVATSTAPLYMQGTLGGGSMSFHPQPQTIFPGSSNTMDMQYIWRKKQLEQQIHQMNRKSLLASKRDFNRQLTQDVQHLTCLLAKKQQAQQIKAPQTVKVNSFQAPSTSSSSMEDMLMKIVKQNEELRNLFTKQQRLAPESTETHGPTVEEEARRQQPASKAPTESSDDSSANTTQQAEKYQSSQKPSTNVAHTKKNVTFERSSSNPYGPSLPTIDWTDKDEKLLSKLMSGNTKEEDELLGLTNAIIENADTVTQKVKKKDDRTESRRRLMQVLQTQANAGALRRPRWRIQLDQDARTANKEGDNVPLPVLGEPMRSIQIFRSGVYAVLMVKMLEHLLRSTKLEQKAKSARDFKDMLHIYFDATKAWLIKLARVPLLSVLQEPKIDLDMTSSSLFQSAAKGFTKKFDAILSLKNTAALETKFLKLKVRVKGLIDAVLKSTEKNDIPSGIVEFLKRISNDGVYFPENYFSQKEKEVLEFDPLGATRNMELIENTPTKVKCYRRHVMLLNFIFIRILIPHIVLQPWDVGIGAKTTSRRVQSNLKNVATLIYLICMRLSSLEEVRFS
jgi:hypothetical protein